MAHPLAAISTNKMSKTSKFILFDAVGTLVYPDPLVEHAYFEIGKAFGSSIQFEEVKARFEKAYREFFVASASQKTNEEIEREKWRSVVGQVFDDVEKFDSVFDELWNYFGNPKSWSLYSDVEATFHALTKQGIPFAIASNFDARFRKIWDQIAPLHFRGTKIFVSTELGFSKPSPKFYNLIIEAIQIPAADVLMVGDSLENDVRAAQAVGMQAILIQRVKLESLSDKVAVKI